MSLTSRIQALTAYANEITGESDTTLADAVATLAEGYGQGGEVYRTPESGIAYEANEVKTLATSSNVPAWRISALLPPFLYCNASHLETAEIIYNGALSFDNTRAGLFYNCVNLKRAVINANIGYFSANPSAFQNCTSLEFLQLGSVGHPFSTAAYNANELSTCTALTELRLYVNAETLADISSDITTYAPYGAPNATVRYFSSNTGLEITT